MNIKDKLIKEIFNLNTKGDDYWGSDENIQNENEIFDYVLEKDIVTQDWFDSKLKFGDVELLQELYLEIKNQEKENQKMFKVVSTGTYHQKGKVKNYTYFMQSNSLENVVDYYSQWLGGLHKIKLIEELWKIELKRF